MAVETGVLPPRYADRERVASGGMGEIYAAEDTELGRKVAVKVLAESLARDASVRRRFTREALAAARLSGHPHIVTIYDVGEWNGRPFIVMEFLRGGTLARRAREERPDHERVLAWLAQAAEAIDAAHEQGIIHRDIKPANLLFDERGALRVVDFGIARIADETTGGMTAAGTVLGTAGYLSPEQARGEQATRASDVYSLAIVAYELLTGGRPFARQTAAAEAAAHIHEPVPPASERGVGLPAAVDVVFARALAKDASRRYASASDFVAALRAALGSEAEPTRVLPAAAPARARPAARPAARRSAFLPVLAGVLVAAALAGALLAVVLTGDEQAPERRARPEEPTRVTITQELTRPGRNVVRTVTETVEGAAPPAATEPTEEVTLEEAIELTDEATSLMRAGNYEDALPLALKAHERLEDTGHTYEAYAAYDVGKSLAELGRCEEARPYLEKRERMLGPHPAVTEAKRSCGFE